MKIAILGLGSAGSRHVDHLLALGHEDLLAYDTKSDDGEGRLMVVNTFEALLDWKPEYAIVASPPQFHYAQALELLENGTHVLVEKPLALRGSEAMDLCKTALKRECLLATGYMERAHPIVTQLAKELADDPAEELVVMQRWMATPKSYEWIGTIWETSHALDLALYLGGPVGRVMVEKLEEHHASVKLIQRDGNLLTHVVMQSNKEPMRVLAASRGEKITRMTYGTVDEFTDCYKAELEAFLHHAPLCDGLDGAAVVSLIERLVA